MPSNKKPRKAYRPRMIKVGYSPTTIEKMQELWMRVSLAIYESIPAGTAIVDDFLCIRDMLNLVMVSCIVRKDIDDEKAGAIIELLDAAAEANNAILQRGIENKHFIARGDELCALNEANAVCDPYIRESIKECPRVFLQEWATMKELTRAKAFSMKKRISFSTVRSAYYRMQPANFRI